MKIELKGYHIEFLLYIIVIISAILLCYNITNKINRH